MRVAIRCYEIHFECVLYVCSCDVYDVTFLGYFYSNIYYQFPPVSMHLQIVVRFFLFHFDGLFHRNLFSVNQWFLEKGISISHWTLNAMMKRTSYSTNKHLFQIHWLKVNSILCGSFQYISRTSFFLIFRRLSNIV